MAERDLIQQLDAAVEAMLRGGSAPAGPEVTDLLRIAGLVRDLPDSQFRMQLKERIMASAEQKPKVNWIPRGFHSVTMYLHPGSARRLIDFLKATLGAEEMEGHGQVHEGRIKHAVVRVGDTMMEIGEPPEPQPTSLRAYVPDVDDAYRRALAAGAVSLYAPVDQNYGDRDAGVRDPEGNVWFFATALRTGDYKHPGLQDVGPYLFARDAEPFVGFLVKALGAEIVGVHKSPEGVVMHADLKIGDSRIMMGEAGGPWQPMPAGLHYYVPDVEAVFARAVGAGAIVVQPPADQPYGERGAWVDDPQGNHWYLATRTA